MTRMPRVKVLEGPHVDPSYADLAWQRYQAEIFCVCASGDVQDAYDLWLSIVTQLLWVDDGDAGLLPGRVACPYEVTSRKGMQGSDVHRHCVRLWHIILDARKGTHVPGQQDSISALTCVEEYLNGLPVSYVDKNVSQCLSLLETAYRLLVAKTKTEGINAWKKRLLESWTKGGAQVYRWLRGHKKSSTFALRCPDESITLVQSEIHSECVRYWQSVYNHVEQRQPMRVPVNAP
eukprot:5853663-Amphidinium_carterae.2